MKKLFVLMLLMSTVLMTHAATVYLTTSDSLGNSSFNTAGGWDSGAAPSAGNDYVVDGSVRLRTPANSTSYTFAGDSLTIVNSGAFADKVGFSYKGNGSTLTIDNLIMGEGGNLHHLNGETELFILDGNIEIAGNCYITALQGPITVNSDISGSATITNAGSHGDTRILTFTSSTSTFTGSIVNDGRFTLADNAVLNFVIGADDVSNSISGSGAVTTLEGDFVIDLTSASTTPGATWTLVSASGATFESTFTVVDFTDNGDNTWSMDANGTTYVFDESTGVLSVNVPELQEDPISGVVYDEEYDVPNGDLSQPGSVVNPGWDTIPGWTALAGTVTDSGTGSGDSADGDGWHAALKATDPNIYNITDANFIEGVQYTFTIQFKPRWYVDQALIGIIAGDDPNAILASNLITFSNNHSDSWFGPFSVTYTATASDAGKKVGFYLDSHDDGGWLRFDDVRLYTEYLEIHGPTGLAPQGPDVIPVTPLELTWTPCNDPNLDGEGIDGQTLYYLIAKGDGSDPDYASYVASSPVLLDSSASTYEITSGIGSDQYCLWRIDTTIDGVTYTGETVLVITLTADEVPDIQDWDWWITWVNEPAYIWADVNDFGEGDIDLTGIQWTVTVGDPNVVVTDQTVDPLYPQAKVVSDTAGEFEVVLIVTDTEGSLGEQPSDPARFVIKVGEDACDAKQLSSAGYDTFDVSGPSGSSDCIVDLYDFAVFAAKWLTDISLTEPLAY